MADDCDISEVKAQLLLDAQIEQTRIKAASMPVGVAGDCGICGDPSLRLVKVLHPVDHEDVFACCRCRDKFIKGRR